MKQSARETRSSGHARHPLTARDAVVMDGCGCKRSPETLGVVRVTVSHADRQAGNVVSE